MREKRTFVFGLPVVLIGLSTQFESHPHAMVIRDDQIHGTSALSLRAILDHHHFQFGGRR
jgi:hypothetical protein